MSITGFSKFKSVMDKGRKAQFAMLADRAKNGGEPLISFESIKNTTLAGFAAISGLKENKWINIPHGAA